MEREEVMKLSGQMFDILSKTDKDKIRSLSEKLAEMRNSINKVLMNLSCIDNSDLSLESDIRLHEVVSDLRAILEQK